jgi:Electron transfer DM13
MKSFSRRPRLLVTTLIAVAFAGVAVAVILTRGGAEGALAQGPPGVLARGSFRGVHTGTEGTAEVVRDRSGNLKLRFSRSFRTQQSPELYVYLASSAEVASSPEGQRVQGKELALLKSAAGPQEYRLPSADRGILHADVEIVCAKCNATYGVARLEPNR